MALTFPRTDIYDPALFEIFDFALFERQEFSRSADGVTRGKDLGPALWRLSFATKPIAASEAVAYEAKLRSLNGVVQRFYAGDPGRCHPRQHKDGNFNDTGVIYSVNANNKALRIDNLDPGFELSVGDYVEFDYGATPSRALHQVMEAVTADGSGLTPEFEVFPHLRPGVDESPFPEVTLKHPQGLFALEPGSVSRRRVRGPLWSVSFSAVQVIE